jgi:hypothetical protein
VSDYAVVALFVGLLTFGSIVGSCLVILFGTLEGKR